MIVFQELRSERQTGHRSELTLGSKQSFDAIGLNDCVADIAVPGSANLNNRNLRFAAIERKSRMSALQM